MDSISYQQQRISPYTPPALHNPDDFWDFAGAPPPIRRVTNVALPTQPLRAGIGLQSEGVDEKMVIGGKQQQQLHDQPLSEAQLENILTFTDEALLRALSKCDDDALRVSCTYMPHVKRTSCHM